LISREGRTRETEPKSAWKLNKQSHADSLPERVRLIAQGTEMVCERTPAGSWICYADDGAPRCARGFTPAIAANWEKLQMFA